VIDHTRNLTNLKSSRRHKSRRTTVKALNSTFSRIIACVLMSLFLFAAVSFAATQPLAEPFGLALDSKGNLYVANFQVGQVLVYNPSYQQIPSKTVTNALRAPTGVAFNGNLFVSDESYNTVNEYSPSHTLLQQLTAPTASAARSRSRLMA
jgi:hypothetical protein